MYYSRQVADKLQADRILALQLEKALSGVKDGVVDNLKRMEGGVTRASWYLSCFTENYQDVCSRLKREDYRFGKAIVRLLKGDKVIYLMILLFVNLMLAGRSVQDLRIIQTKLLSLGVNISNSFLTSQALSAALTTSISFSLNFRTKFIGNLNRVSSFGVFLSSTYGYIQKASESARRLSHTNPEYYRVLYQNDVEMLYFIIEPAIVPKLLLNKVFHPKQLSPEEIAQAFAELAR
ncbi:hypothetical protein PMPD1_2209 [Paramixta manurensis]|uniref:Uncharacterized protein n=1 Tax=Paramixta manurensis TaxID=2740817 RepID=A0A6M8UC75_9GAMM|nr:hypothetical protein PMPD1_2209 [Erwiniaceae bacterium PD-1]